MFRSVRHWLIYRLAGSDSVILNTHVSLGFVFVTRHELVRNVFFDGLGVTTTRYRKIVPEGAKNAQRFLSETESAEYA